MNCFRYLGFTSLEQVDRLSVWEYNLLMEAASLKAVDESHYIHMQAWLNQAAQAQKKVGKRKSRPLYQKFTDFFDYDKAVRDVTRRGSGTQEKKSITERMMDFMRGRK